MSLSATSAASQLQLRRAINDKLRGEDERRAGAVRVHGPEHDSSDEDDNEDSNSWDGAAAGRDGAAVEADSSNNSAGRSRIEAAAAAAESFSSGQIIDLDEIYDNRGAFSQTETRNSNTDETDDNNASNAAATASASADEGMVVVPTAHLVEEESSASDHVRQELFSLRTQMEAQQQELVQYLRRSQQQSGKHRFVVVAFGCCNSFF